VRVKGRGIAAVSYPTGMNLGGDPTSAIIIAQPGGTFSVLLSSVEMGQGIRTAMAQIAAEFIGVNVVNIEIKLSDTDVTPYDAGSFASRSTHRAGNAIKIAAMEVRRSILNIAAKELEEPIQNLEIKQGQVFVKQNPSRKISVEKVIELAMSKYSTTIVGQGFYTKPKSFVDPDTGACDPHSAMGHACAVVDVEVDIETGEVEVKKLVLAIEAGLIVNPALVLNQAIGGAVMSITHVLTETVYPYYPSYEYQAKSFNDYIIAKASSVPSIEVILVSNHFAESEWIFKGVGEMVVTAPTAAIVDAIFDAIGVWLTDLPITPEKILRALEEKRIV